VKTQADYYSIGWQKCKARDWAYDWKHLSDLLREEIQKIPRARSWTQETIQLLERSLSKHGEKKNIELGDLKDAGSTEESQ